jgi:hypothetical protein
MNRPIVIRNANGQADSPLPAGADAPPTGQLDDAETPRRAEPADAAAKAKPSISLYRLTIVSEVASCATTKRNMKV